MNVSDSDIFDYRRPGKHGKVFSWVVTGHVVVLGLLFVYFVCESWFKKPPPQTISVNLGSIPAMAATQQGRPDAVPPKEQAQPNEPEQEQEQESEPPAPEPPKPEPPKPTPPKPEPPKPEEPKEKAPAPVEKPKEKPKEPPKEEVKEQPKTPPKEPPKKKVLDPSDIKKTGKVVTKKAVKPLVPFSPLPVATVPTVNPNLVGPPGNIGDELSRNLKGIAGPGSLFGGGMRGGMNGSPNGDGGSRANAYLDQVQAILHRRWRQPIKSSLGGRNPVVGVRITVDGSGRVTGASITRASGVSPMDMSVKDLLDRLASLPPPPPGLSLIEVELEALE